MSSSEAILPAIIEMLDARAIFAKGVSAASRVEDMRIDELTLDSLDLLQFGVDIEDRLGIVVEADDLPQKATLAELADFIAGLPHPET